MGSQLVVCSRQDALTILRMNDPEHANALTMAMKDELLSRLTDFFGDPAQRCLIITGTDRFFCAGGDLSTLRHGQDAPSTRKRLANTYAIIRTLLLGEKPVITAINGAAAGGGFGLALLGDVILASNKAKFRPAFPAVGVAADVGVALTLSRAIGSVRARHILLANLTVAAEEAAKLGFVSAVYAAESLMTEATALGHKLAEGPTQALGLTKRLLHSAHELSLDTYLDQEFAAQAVCFGTSDCQEGVSAFYEKRVASFTGK